jgi:hypothetical protein
MFLELQGVIHIGLGVGHVGIFVGTHIALFYSVKAPFVWSCGLELLLVGLHTHLEE